MNKNLFFITFAALFLALTSMADGTSSKTFDNIMESYETIRLTLLQDSTEGIGERAMGIREVAEASTTDGRESKEIRSLLTKIAGFAGEVAAAEDIEVARAAFYEMSKMLVQYRSKIQGEDLPQVMYCPMAKKSWLQLEEEVGNPYHGQSMPRCGNDVSD